MMKTSEMTFLHGATKTLGLFHAPSAGINQSRFVRVFLSRFHAAMHKTSTPGEANFEVIILDIRLMSRGVGYAFYH